MSKTTAQVLDEVMHEKRITQADIARKVRVTPQAVQQWCSGKSTPRGPKLALLSEYLGVPPDVILFGTTERSVVQSIQTEDGYVSIPRFDVNGSCGGGAVGTHCQLIEMMKVSQEWLLNKCPTINFKHLEVITAVGDSMSPTIENLDFVFVDRSICRVIRDGIYVVSYSGEIFIKRIQRQISGGLLLISDNTKYPPMLIEPSDLDRVKIEGLCKIHCSADEI